MLLAEVCSQQTTPGNQRGGESKWLARRASRTHRNREASGRRADVGLLEIGKLTSVAYDCNRQEANCADGVEGTIAIVPALKLGAYKVRHKSSNV
jgi:hypothetical protein